MFQLAARYNAYIDPLQILIYIPTLLIFVLLLRGAKQDTSRGVLLLLGAKWAVVGVLFFFTVVTDRHWIGYVCGAYFLASGLYFTIGATRSFPPHFKWRRGAQTWISTIVTAYGAMLYPLSSLLFGRSYPQTTTFGLMPGSVALITLGVALAARPAPRLWLLLPALIVAATSPLTMWWWGVWEDLALLPIGVVAVVAWFKWRGKLTEAPTKDTIRFDF